MHLESRTRNLIAPERRMNPGVVSKFKTKLSKINRPSVRRSFTHRRITRYTAITDLSKLTDQWQLELQHNLAEQAIAECPRAALLREDHGELPIAHGPVRIVVLVREDEHVPW